jgi:cyclic pyranopterin phosphate synthase
LKVLSHVDHSNQPTMVNVVDKSPTHRIAEAQAIVWLPPAVSQKLIDGELHTKKGPVFATAIIAGTMAVKRTSELIPFCHSVPVDGCRFEIKLEGAQQLMVNCRVETCHKTGVEMEALTGASIAALTIYDMCKALSHDIRIESTRLLSKSGGKHEFKTST